MTVSTAEKNYHLIKELTAALEAVTHQLENWMEIADDEDVRDADAEAIQEARRLLVQLRSNA